jgi:hypothetical protein
MRAIENQHNPRNPNAVAARALPAIAAVAALAVGLAAPAPAAAESPAELHGDVEVDPTAYALSGYSVHAGFGWSRLRVDLGAFAMALPGFVHGNEGFDASFDGFGAKLQYFPLAEQAGLFVGVDAGLGRMLVQRDGTDLAARRRQLTAGVDAGWRFELWEGLYATPWLGVGYAFNARDVVLGGQTFQSSPWVLFPAVHLGYRFR